MQYITIRSLPQIYFAHVFEIDKYKNTIRPQKDLIEILCVTKGSLRVCTAGDEVIINQGGIFICTYAEPVFVEAKAYHEHHTVAFRVQFELSETPGEASVPTFAARPGENCVRLIDDIIRTNTLYGDSALKSAGLGLQLLYELGAQASDNRSPYVGKAKKYIFKHIHEPIRQSDIAEALGITPEYLCYVFKKHEKTTVMSFVNRVKLDSIRSVMQRERLPLYKAAELYGYTDPNYVSRLYKKLFHANISDAIYAANK